MAPRPADRDARWIAAEFDRRATTYDRSEMHIWQADQAIRRLDAQPGERVLDVAAGTGLAARAMPTAFVVGVDLSEQMLRVGREASAAWYPVRADTHRLPFWTGTFDAVLCVAAIPYFDDLDAVVREWVRVTRPGGRMLLNLPAADGIAAHRLVREAAAAHGLTVANPHALGTEVALRARLEPLGLRVRSVEVARRPDTLATAPDEAYATMLEYGFGEEVRQAPTGLRHRIRASYLDAYRATRDRGDAEHRALFVHAEPGPD